MSPDLIALLKVYHVSISLLASFSALAVMQITGQQWTTSARSSLLKWMQRAGLGLLSIALFCSAGRVPHTVDVIALMSAAAINTAVAAIMFPTVLIGRMEEHAHRT